MRRAALLALLVPFMLAGCGTLAQDQTKDWTAERFYREARTSLDQGNYEDAIKIFEQLQGRFPYGRYAEQANLEIAYAQYKWDEPALAIAACDRFIRQYPTHPNVDYAYYLKGIIDFRDKRSIANWLFDSEDDLTNRNIKGIRDAYDVFKELVQRFPNSRYAPDAVARMNYLFNAQARYEIYIANQYYRLGAYVATVNRAKYVLENFPRTPATEDALGLQVLSYKKMGMQKLFDDSLKIIRQNFPQSRYLKEIETTPGVTPNAPAPTPTPAAAG